MAEYMHLVHCFESVYDENSRVLILGSFPSVKSREEGFYYGHPRNRFWRLIAELYGAPLPQTTEEKTALLKACGVALWDSIAECDIAGSDDSSIKNAKAADIAGLLKKCPIERIYANGAAAARVYAKFQQERCGMSAVTLPSTSPANAAWSFERLKTAWERVTRGE